MSNKTLDQPKMISKEQLLSIMPSVTVANLEKFLVPLNEAMEKWEINTLRRQAMFLAQLAHESGSFRYVRELADGKAYEGRKDLGNIEPGDGVKFKGRGLIQITGRTNYEKYFASVGLPTSSDPALLEGAVHATNSAGWFWKTRGLNEIADKPDTWAHRRQTPSDHWMEYDPFEWISVRINGINKTTQTANGIEDRLRHYHNAKIALGL